MIDVDPQLDARLRSFYEQIEEGPAPSQLLEFEPPAFRRDRRPLNMAVGAVGLLAVAAGIAVFAVELNSHRDVSPATTTHVSPLPRIPLFGDAGLPASAQVVVPLRSGTGSAQIRTFVPEGTLYIQFDCVGKGAFTVRSTNSIVDNVLEPEGCSSSFGAITWTVDGPKTYDGHPITLAVAADPAMRWGILIAESGIGLPPLGGAGLPAHSKTLVPATVFAGSTPLPTFTPTEPYYIETACIGGGPFDIKSSDGSENVQQYGCGSVGGYEWISPSSPGQVLGHPLTLLVDAPEATWEVLVVESDVATSPNAPPPSVFGVPSQSSVLVPATRGTGPAQLPTFTPNGTYYIEYACSGPGGLSIAFTSGAPFGGSSNCLGLDTADTIGSDPNQPTVAATSLGVQVDPSTSWEILIYQTSGPPHS